VDQRRFAELFALEAQEHLRLLDRSLLDLETGAGAAALDEAFRAAHTLKGIAAAMGHEGVASRAHALEDRLVRLRQGEAVVDAGLIDTLLAEADGLAAAVRSVLAGPAPSEAAAARARARALVVRLAPDAIMKGARAALIYVAAQRRGLVAAGPVPEFADDFDGVFRLVPAPGADRSALERLARDGGDVAAVEWEVERGPPDHAPLPVLPVRVDPRRLDALADGLGQLAVLYARAGPGTATGPPHDPRVGGLLSELQGTVQRLRLLPVGVVFERMPRVVRDAARALDRQVGLEIEGSDIELDRAILDELFDPLVHLLRNAVDHGIEPASARVRAGKPPRGSIVLRAERERTSVRITVRDDGGGIDRARIHAKAQDADIPVPPWPDALDDDALLRLLAHPGLSTAERVSEVSGRGVGMDVVVTRIRALGGAITLRSEPGQGTTFTLRLPVTLALTHALRVRVGGEEYAIPLTHVTEAVELQDVLVSAVGGRETLRVRDDLLPLIRLREVLGMAPTGIESAAVVAEYGEHRAALAVDELVGSEQILLKGFAVPRDLLPVFSGATLLADGRPALVLDPLSVV
jgi:two-component system chemotaxis sensor kinase CheA